MTDRTMLELGAEELLVVGALRAWMAETLRPAGTAPAWRDLLGLARIPAEGARGFQALMATIGLEAWCLVEIHDCPCPRLGPDEAQLIALLRALQRGEAMVAEAILGRWLPPGAVRAAAAAATRFAGAMDAAGWRLPAPVLPFPAAKRQRVLH